MLSLAWHVGNKRCWGPDQFIPGFLQGLAHGQFMQVRDHVFVGAFIPLMWDILWGVIPIAHSTVFCNPHTHHTDESLHQKGDLGGKAFTSRYLVPDLCGFPKALECIGIGLQPLLYTPSIPSSRNCPMYRTIGAGRQVGGVESATSYLNRAISHWARPRVAMSLPSITGQTRGHHISLSSSYCPSQLFSHLVVCHKGPILLPLEEKTMHYLMRGHFPFLSGTPKLDSVGVELMEWSIFLLLPVVVQGGSCGPPPAEEEEAVLWVL